MFNNYPQNIHSTNSFLMNYMSSNMSSQMNTPGFFLYRTTTAGDSFDPTAAIQFYPAKDSDELFDALRAAYPASKTHSERMRDAVIDFLLRERNEEQAKNHLASTPSTTWSSWPSNSSASSNLSSPDLIDLATPASLESPMPSMSRQASRSSNSGRASLEQMTGVFSLSSSSQPKTRIRRKMTDSEKAEYRKRRIVKACDQCSKRKRKCQHNQERMETLAPSSSKVTKKKSPSSTSSFHRTEATPPPSSVFELDPLSYLQDDSLFALDSVAQETASTDSVLNLMDFDYGQQTAPAAAWPWSDTQDWTLMDAQPGYNMAQSEPLFGEISNFAIPHTSSQHVPGNNFNFDIMTTQQAATHTWHTHAAQNPSGEAQSFVNPADLSPRDRGLSEVIPEFDTSNIAAGPTRSRRLNGDVDGSASTGGTETAAYMNTNAHQTAGPTLTVHQTQLLQGGQFSPTFGLGQEKIRSSNAMPSDRSDVSFEISRSYSSGAQSGSSNGHGHDLLSHSFEGISQSDSRQTIVKNKGPEHASRKSAASASDTIEGGQTKSPLGGLNVRRTQQSSALGLAQHLSADQAARENASSSGSETSRGGHIHFSPAFARGLDFNFSDLQDMNTIATASPARGGASSSGAEARPVHTRGRSPRTASAGGSHSEGLQPLALTPSRANATKPSAQSSGDDVGSAVTRVQGSVRLDSRSSSTPMTRMGLDCAVSSLPASSLQSLAPFTGAASGSAYSLFSGLDTIGAIRSSATVGNAARKLPTAGSKSTSLVVASSNTSFSASSASVGGSSSKATTPAKQQTSAADHDRPRSLFSTASAHSALAASSSASVSLVEPRRHKAVAVAAAQGNATADTGTDAAREQAMADRPPTQPLASSIRLSHGKASLVARNVSSQTSTRTNALTTFVTLSSVSNVQPAAANTTQSSHLLEHVKLLTTEMLKSFAVAMALAKAPTGQRPQTISSSSGRRTRSHQALTTELVACV